MNEYAGWVEGADLDAEDILGSGQVALVVEGKKGTRLSNQSGGYSCAHPVVVGEVSRLFTGDRALAVSDMLLCYFTGSHHNGWCTDRMGDSEYGFDKRDADAVDAALETLELRGWQVDRDRLGDCMEAWVWVRNDALDKKGVLCWGNSD